MLGRGKGVAGGDPSGSGGRGATAARPDSTTHLYSACIPSGQTDRRTDRQVTPEAEHPLPSRQYLAESTQLPESLHLNYESDCQTAKSS